MQHFQKIQHFQNYQHFQNFHLNKKQKIENFLTSQHFQIFKFLKIKKNIKCFQHFQIFPILIFVFDRFDNQTHIKRTQNFHCLIFLFNFSSFLKV